VNRADYVYQETRSDILACRLKPGSKIKINELCTRYSVSLGAVREALSRLAAEELAVAESQKGYRVAPVTREELVDLTIARQEIEALCLRKAIQEGSVEWESAVVASFHTLSRTPERPPGDKSRLDDRWATAHAEFHTALVSGCSSKWLKRMRITLYEQSERYRRLSVTLADADRDVAAEHKEIMTQAIARNSKVACKLIRGHLAATSQIILDSELFSD